MPIPLSSLSFGWRDILDISLVTLLFYHLILMVKQTRAVSAIYGLLIVIVAYFLSTRIGLVTLNLLLENVLGSLFLIVVIVFQRDIRQALTSIGARQWGFFFRKKGPDPVIGIVSEAALYLAQRKIGALVVLERNMALRDTTDRGVILDAALSRELLIALFWPNNPLHDGAALIRGARLVAAGCILPLSSALAERDYGTRHRAALGLTEESDAVVVVVSEERGVAAVAVAGKLSGALDGEKLPRVLAAVLEKST
ncbi:MAG: diadenylate cyclase CdaA [Deltaproteobacteria bacterium]|jgi:uncharacterized protein (TIGR00159 family)|nr:diadenylate cyclase CdaA [Deltaproteobacteria bacterium]